MYDIMNRWKLDDVSPKCIKQRCTRLSNEQWMARADGKRLRDIKQSVHTSSFLRHDPKPVVCLRARLRQDMANTGQSRFNRNLTSSPKCERCGAAVDDRQHLLLHCSRFASSRITVQTALSELQPPVPFEVRTILGVCGDDGLKLNKSAKKWRQSILDITGDYLVSINTSMHRL